MNNTVINDHRLFVRRAYNNYDKKKNLRNQFLEQRTNKIRANKYSGAKSKVKQTCIVCFTENSSAESCILDCQHVICKECIVLYIQHLVDNKEVESIICPKDGCHCELSFNHIQKTIPSHLLKEYDRCLVDNYLNKRDDIVWCPIADCRCPVFVTKNMTEGRCPKCKFAFCTKCGEKYHGISKCNEFKNEDEKTLVANQYMYGSFTEKAELERKYTKTKLENELENVLSNHCIK
ncbi:E3 ubiquitin-protein ligase RNF14-like protein, partial [Leptotrombidium deliense]